MNDYNVIVIGDGEDGVPACGRRVKCRLRTAAKFNGTQLQGFWLVGG